MPKTSKKSEFIHLFLFLLVSTLLLSNGFVARISAEENKVDVYRELEPVGVVFDTVMREYVRDVDIKKIVEGALIGVMGSLDRNSSFITEEELTQMREETKGEFEGIGVSIRQDKDGKIIIFSPLPGSPAAGAGIKPFDQIIAIDGKPTTDMTTSDAAQLIKGRRGTTVKLTILRKLKEAPPDATGQQMEFEIKRDTLPLESIKEAQILNGQIGYVRISDFKDNTGADLTKRLQEFIDAGAKSIILDLRWNPGGLLTASKDTAELFVPKGSLVTYTRGRTDDKGRSNNEDMRLITGRKPILPEGMPVLVLVNRHTASSAEIVTGCLQFHERAVVLGEKTYGKGSVQTIIPMQKPENTALRLTTALYYTPADVTIDGQGILPDIELPMTPESEEALAKQMQESFENEPERQYHQNHGRMTDYPVTDKTVDDAQLARACEVLNEDSVWSNLVQKYHRNVKDTQMNAETAKKKNGAAGGPAADTPKIEPGSGAETAPTETPQNPATPAPGTEPPAQEAPKPPDPGTEPPAQEAPKAP